MLTGRNITHISVLFAFLIFLCSSVSAQDCGEPVEDGNTPDNLGNMPFITGWPTQAAVTVNLDPNTMGGLNSPQIQAAEQAIKNWAGVGGVTFTFTYNATSASPLPTNTVQVSIGVVPGHPEAMGGTFNHADPTTHNEQYATIYLDPNTTDLTVLASNMSHELGHTFGLNDNLQVDQTVMSNGCGDNNSACGSSSPSQADMAAADCNDGYTSNTCVYPGNANNPACQCGAGTSGACSGGLSCMQGICGCASSCDDASCPGYDYNTCECPSYNCNPDCENYNPNCQCSVDDKPGCPTAACQGGQWTCLDSPIMIDVKGEGFRLTDAAHGVPFDFFGDGSKVQISWTDPAYGNAWLVLDRNGNGRIDDAREMFGNLTEQPPSDAPNGYLALAEFDKASNGGNGDGYIDSGDAVYSRLRLWIDANHNGVSEPNELYTLDQWHIFRIGLHYQARERKDRFGNVYRYRAEIWDRYGKTADRWTYDVFLQQYIAP